MQKLRAFVEFWYDFVVGDDWRVASTVVVALGATVAVDRITGSAPWWILVGTVVFALPASIYRLMRSQRSPRPPSS